MDFERKPAGTDTLICLCCDFEKEVAMLISAKRKTFIAILCVKFWKNQTCIKRYCFLYSFLQKESNITFHNQGKHRYWTAIKRIFQRQLRRTGGGPLSVDKVDTNTGIGRTGLYLQVDTLFQTPGHAKSCSQSCKALFCNVQREGDLCDLTRSCFRPSQQRFYHERRYGYIASWALEQNIEWWSGGMDRYLY